MDPGFDGRLVLSVHDLVARLTDEQGARVGRRTQTAVVDDAKEAAERRFDEIAEVYLDRPAVSRQRKFASEALLVGGKIVGFVGKGGRLVVKVPAGRAADLVQRGLAERVRLGRNLAREWIGLPGDSALWHDLLDESFAYVAAVGRRTSRDTARPGGVARGLAGT
jgi:hypothetical protein